MTNQAPNLPLVTVVIPTFNAASTIDETIEAVAGQTYPHIQLIVIDDGSTDGTPDHVRARHEKVQVLEQRNQGVAAARNVGLESANGEFVAFLDQDDVWHPMQIERQVACLVSNSDAVAVATRYAHWFPGDDGCWRPIALPSDPGLTLVPGFESWTYHHFLRDCWALTSATLIRTTPLRAVGGFNPAIPFSEDWDLWLRLSLRHPFLQLAWPLVAYRQHPIQGSRTVRPVDHRFDLLCRYARDHGLASPDGHAMAPSEFCARLARYKMEFGYQHLMSGRRGVAVASLVQAWRLSPGRLRWLILALAGALGWRPSTGPRRPAR